MNTPMNAQMINTIIASKNFYYAQGLGSSGGFKSFKTVILASDKKEAEAIGKKWQATQGFRELHLYRNNYKLDCKGMLSAGNYYGEYSHAN